jgi:signal transduction histidine kinase/FixJ family two-component response regulator
MKEKILLVDDEEGIRKVFGIILKDMGYDVLIAENGKQALEIFPVAQPPIVLIDIKMPGMDGIELLRKLKQANPETEVIIITGHGDMQLAIQSLQYEATDFITKPIDERLLARALRKARERILIQRQVKDYTTNLEDLLKQKAEKLAAAARLEAGGTEAYRHLFDELPGYVTVLAPDFSIKAANRLFKQDFAYHPRGEEVRHCYEVLKGSDEPCIDCLVEQTINDGQSHQREMKLTTADGSRLNLFAWTTPLQTREQTLEGVMLMAMDISQIIDLKDRLASLGLMIGSVSHGIKGLLTGLDGGLYMINSGVSREEPAKINEGLATVKVMADRIRSLILDILYYSKERELTPESTPIGAFMESVAAVVAPKAHELQIPFLRELAPALRGRTVLIDRDQLSTALVNIIENAIEACQSDTAKSAHEVRFRAEAFNGSVVFHIEDNGIGMSAETLNHIFTLFYSSKGTHGTGIGLFVAKKIVQQHGGGIEVDSRPGVSTRFHIAIPLEPAA